MDVSSSRGSVNAESLRTALALRKVIDETRRITRLLKHAADSLHEADQLTAAERRLLVEFADRDPATVPEIARGWQASRQHVQTVVNALVRNGLVQLLENQRHRRSRLVGLTSAGREAAIRLRSREGRVAAALVPHFQAADLETTARTLAALGGIMTSHFQRANHASHPDRQR